MTSKQNIRVVITGVGLTAPNANHLNDFRRALLNQKSGISEMEVRYMGKVAAGNCNFDEYLYQKKKCVAGEPGPVLFRFTARTRH